jgi:hypothetical protein
MSSLTIDELPLTAPNRTPAISVNRAIVTRPLKLLFFIRTLLVWLFVDASLGCSEVLEPRFLKSGSAVTIYTPYQSETIHIMDSRSGRLPQKIREFSLEARNSQLPVV